MQFISRCIIYADRLVACVDYYEWYRANKYMVHFVTYWAWRRLYDFEIDMRPTIAIPTPGQAEKNFRSPVGVWSKTFAFRPMSGPSSTRIVPRQHGGCASVLSRTDNWKTSWPFRTNRIESSLKCWCSCSAWWPMRHALFVAFRALSIEFRILILSRGYVYHRSKRLSTARPLMTESSGFQKLVVVRAKPRMLAVFVMAWKFLDDILPC